MGFFDRGAQPAQPLQADRAQIQAQAQRDFDGIRANPNPYIEQARVDIPQNMRRDPRAMCMHLINTNQVAPAVMQRAQPLINMLMGGRR